MSLPSNRLRTIMAERENSVGLPSILTFSGRGDTIRTCDLYVPNVALYRAELHPDDGRCKNSSVKAEYKSAFSLLSIATGWGSALCQ